MKPLYILLKRAMWLLSGLRVWTQNVMRPHSSFHIVHVYVAIPCVLWFITTSGRGFFLWSPRGADRIKLLSVQTRLLSFPTVHPDNMTHPQCFFWYPFCWNVQNLKLDVNRTLLPSSTSIPIELVLLPEMILLYSSPEKMFLNIHSESLVPKLLIPSLPQTIRPSLQSFKRAAELRMSFWNRL